MYNQYVQRSFNPGTRFNFHSQVLLTQIQTHYFWNPDARAELEGKLDINYVNDPNTKLPHYVGLRYTRVTPAIRAKLSALIPCQPLFHSLPEDDFYACWSEKMRN